MSTLPPAVLIHLTFALSAVLLGPAALWARKGSRPHRMLGYFWVAAMLGTALSSLFIHGGRLPNLAGFSPIHLLTLLTFVGVSRGLWLVSQGRIAEHRKTMRGTYIGACLIAGAFTLLPGRTLGQLLWHQTLGWM